MHTENGEPTWSRVIRRLNRTRSSTGFAVGAIVRRGWRLVAALSLLPATLSAAESPCEHHPIALSAAALAGMSPGDVLPDALNGGAPGNFGWLTWAGSPSVPTLVESLTPKGNSSRYVNSYNPHDHELSIGDWVRGKPGVSNSKHVRDALDRLKDVDITVPVWDQVRGSGSTAEYRVVAFARVRLLSYRLPGRNWIRVRFLGHHHCAAVNRRPTVDAGPDQTVLLTHSVHLSGAFTDDGRPEGSAVVVQWSQVSGPGTAVFSDASALDTRVDFDLPGTYELRLTASDTELTASDICLVAVNQPNRPPVATPPPLLTTEDTALDFELTAVDPDHDPLTYRVITPPAHGTLTGEPPQLRYLPFADYSGPDRFTYDVSDGELASGETEQLIEIAAVNDPPVADPQTLSTFEDLAVSIQLSGSDIEGEALSFEILDVPANGALTGLPPGLTYTPALNSFGSESFRFRVSDGTLQSAEATVVILIGEVNDPPVAFAQVLSLSEDSPLPVTLTGADIEGNSLAFAVVAPPAHGTLSGTAPDLTYVPARNHHGADAFTFRVDDGELASEAATVTLAIAAVNDPPEAHSRPVDTAEDTPILLVLEGEDVDGDALSFEIIEPPVHGTVTGTPPDLIYTPGPDFAGADVFRFRVTDGALVSEAAAVNITVHPVNDPPVALPQELTTVAGVPLALTLTGEDIELDELTFELLEQPEHGTLTGIPPHLTYTPEALAHGADQLTFRVHDGELPSPPATVAFVIHAANQPPTLAITTPVAGELFEAGQPVLVRIEASDDAAVEQVRLFANGELLAELPPTAPEFVWHNPPVGIHLLNATAGDASGASTLSEPVEIQVLAAETGDFTVDAGPDQIVVWPDGVSVAGSIGPAGLPDDPSGMVSWLAPMAATGVHFLDPHALATTVSFNAPGEYELRLAVQRGNGFRTDRTRIVVLPPATGRLETARSHRGREFWFTLLNNHPLFVEPNYFGNFLVLQSGTDADVTITTHFPFVEQPLLEQRLKLVAGASSLFELPADQYAPELDASDTLARNAVHIRADAPVSVWLFNYRDGSSEGTLLLPTVMLGTEYRVMAYQNSESPNHPGDIIEGSQFAVVATEPDTRVTIVPAATVGSRAAGVAYEILLQPGETYRLIDQENLTGDLTGTLILANRPIAAFGGHTCANVPAGVTACNFLVEQLPPVDTWGRRFLTLPLAGRSGGDALRVLASVDDTVLRIGGELLHLNRGQLVERVLTAPTQILASQPVLVAQFAQGSAVDGQSGDPAMQLVPPVEQFGGSHTFRTPPPVWHNFLGNTAEVFQNHVNLVLPAAGIESLRLDGAPVAGGHVQSIGDSGYVGAQVPVAPGQHQVTASVPVGVWAYGWATFDAYGSLGGMFSDTTRTGVSLALSQVTGSARVGHTKTVTARVTDELGRPLADYQIEFEVTGANPQVERITSNPLGLAILEYVGNTPGDDAIIARLAGIERSLANSWVGSSGNDAPEVDVGPDRAMFLTDTLALDPVVTDDGFPVGAGLTARWRTSSGPVVARFADPHAAVSEATFDLPGRYELELSVSDSEFETAKTLRVNVLFPVSLTLTAAQFVEAYQGWEAVASGQAVPTGRAVQLHAGLSGSDVAAEWTFEFFDAEDPLPGDGAATLQVDQLGAGSHVLTVRATGPAGITIEGTPLTIHVTSPPIISVLAPLADQTIAFDESVALRATATDPDGSVAGMAVYFGPWLVAEVTSGELDVTGLLPGWGTQTLYFTATDNYGLTTGLSAGQITIVPPVVEVTLTSPVSGQNFRLGEPILLTADATVSPPAAVSQVIFEWWGTLPWEWFPYWHFAVAAEEPPYAAILAPSNFNYPAMPGIFEYRARAVSTFDGTATTPPIAVNVLPTIGVTITTPANGATLFVGNTYLIELNVDDPTASFAGAEFFINGGPAIASPESRLEWTPPGPGGYALHARVLDRAGQSYDADSSIAVEVIEPPVPVVQIVEPVAGATLPAGQRTFVFGEVADPAGVVTNATLLVNGVAVQSRSSAGFTWEPDASASHRLEIRVQDRLGRQVTSPPIIVAAAPEIYVGISHPEEGELLPLDQETEVTASVGDPGNMVLRLELLVNDIKVDESEHIHLRWTPTTSGPHTLQVVAWDREGGSHPSVIIPVTVAPLIRPTIQLLAPASGSSWVANHPIPLTVTSGDTDGAVVEVQIRSNGKAIVTTNKPSFTFDWPDATPGWHELIATARDDTGQFTPTDPVRIWVDYELMPGVPAPANLRAVSHRAGHARVSWDPVSVTGLSGYAILRKTEPDGEWNRVGWAEPGRLIHEQSILSAQTTYSYQVRAVVGINHQAGPPAEGIVRTRSVMPEYGILDLTELVIGGGAGPGSLGGGSRKSVLSPKPGLPIQNRPGRVTSLDSFSPVDRGPFRVLGISDANEILLAHEDGKFSLWFPGGADDLTFPGFQPERVTRSGVVVGSIIVEVTDDNGAPRPQRRAARWDRVNGLVAVGGDPGLYREPLTHAPLSENFDAFHALFDVNVPGQAVGQASYVYFLNSLQNNDGDPHFIANHGTLWLGDAAVNLGGVGVLNGFSRAAAINDAGMIVGWGAITETEPGGQPISTQTHAARADGRHWSESGGMVDLGTLGGSFSAAFDVNNQGLAVGYSTLHPEDPIGLSQATLWLPDSTLPTQLPNLGGVGETFPEGYGYAVAINDSNRIVGESVRPDGAMAATLWQRTDEPEEPGDPGTWEAEDLNVLADDDVWLLTNAVDINDGGLIVGQGIKWIPDPQHPQQGEWMLRAFLLVPGSLLTDANRDGVIDTRPGPASDDRNRVSRLKPWRFWINDDRDRGDEGRTSKDDVPGSAPAPAPQLELPITTIPGTRDLVDFFPLCLDIQGLLNLFPPPEFAYNLEQTDSAIRFVETDLPPADANAYLTDVATAQAITTRPLRLARSPVWPTEGRLTAGFLNRIRTQGGGIILVEGRRPTQHPIRLELWRNGGLVLRLFFGLSTSGVEDMYRFKNLLAAGGGPALPGDRLEEPANYPDELGSTRNFVFLHGYNVTMNESRGWQSEMFKRLFWAGSRARFHGVSWYGYQTKVLDSFTPDYHVNVDNAFQSSGALAAFLGQVAATGITTVAAHSLGNMVVSAALQDFGPSVENYFMLDAAVALEAYDASETRSRTSPNHNMVHWEWDGPGGAYKESLRASEWYTLFPDDDHRRALTWRGRFDRVPLMNVWNYYSSGEEVLQAHPQAASTLVEWNLGKSAFLGLFTSDEFAVESGRYAWALQEKNKGRGLTLLGLADPVRLGSSDIGGWEFNDDDYYFENDDGERRRLTPAEANDINPLELRTKPFFTMGRFPELYGSNGSEYALLHRDRLLGEMIPARSLPAGANPISLLKVTLSPSRNQDMDALFKNGWPQDRMSHLDNDWRHSDLTDVAYLYVWPLYQAFINRGLLDKD